jgi:hypothetical protein
VPVIPILRHRERYLDPMVLCVDFRFLLHPTRGRRGRIVSNGESGSFCAVPPFEVVGTFRMPLLPAIDQNPVRSNATIGGKNDWTVAETLKSFDALGDVDFAIQGDPFLILGISLDITTPKC